MNTIKTYILALLFMPTQLISQEVLPSNGLLKNEIGTDITVLLKQVLNFNSEDYASPYNSVYNISYKRNFSEFTVRMAAGGTTLESSTKDIYTEKDLPIINYLVNYRVGIERKIPMGSKWELYYGFDFKQSYDRNQNTSVTYSSGWRTSYNRTNNMIGASPFFGVEFKLSERVCLQTEANFIIYKNVQKSQPIIETYVPVPFGEGPSNETIERVSYGSGFGVPNFLFLTLKF